MSYYYLIPLLPLLTITTSFFLASSFVHAQPAPHKAYFSKIYAFGDSFTDTGNTHSLTGPNFFGRVSDSPYGITFFHHPTNRYSDGRLVIDFVANSLSLPFLPPYRNRTADFSHGVNFAVAGSTANDYEFFVKNNVSLDITPQSLGTQLDWFNKHLEGQGCTRTRLRKCKMAMGDALFWVGEIGVNDYAYSLASTVPSTAIQSLAIQKVVSFLQVLLKKGAKYVVVQGLPMAGCLPLSLILTTPDDRDAIGCAESINKVIQAHNSALQSKIQELRKQYPHSLISYADYQAAHRTVMMNPSKFGLKETFMTCCGSGGPPYNFQLSGTCGSPDAPKACADPTKYVNWDGVHLTEAMYKVVADLLLRRGFIQPSFNQLLESKRRGFQL